MPLIFSDVMLCIQGEANCNQRLGFVCCGWRGHWE